MLKDQTLPEEYLESVGLFYDQKVKFLSIKDNFISCNNCPEKKEFTEKYDEITLSCGDKNEKGECGIKIKIQFPKYLHYQKDIVSLQKKLETGINLETINNYIHLTDKLKENTIREVAIKEKINEITNQFYQINIEHKKEHIHTFYKSRLEKTKQCRNTLAILNNNDTNETTKEQLRKEYVQTVIQLNQEYKEITELIDTFNPYLKIKDPIVTINFENEEDLDTTIKKKKNKKELIDIILEYFKENNGRMSKTAYEGISINFKTKWDGGVKGLFSSLRYIPGTTNTKPWKKKEQEKYGPIIEDATKDSKEIRLTQEWMKYLKIDKKDKKDKKETQFSFLKGDTINWMKGEEIIEGNILQNTKQTKKLIHVVDKNGKEYYIPKEKINKGGHEPEPEPEPE